MKENLLDLSKILTEKDVGRIFYSPVYGDLKLSGFDKGTITFRDSLSRNIVLSNSGRLSVCGELVVFPSKRCRDWYKWQVDGKVDRWLPEPGEMVNYFDSCLRVNGFTYDGNHYGEYAMELHKSLNCFRTTEQLKEALSRVKKVLIDYHKEIGE